LQESDAPDQQVVDPPLLQQGEEAVYGIEEGAVAHGTSGWIPEVEEEGVPDNLPDVDPRVRRRLHG
jgi:hypothetical protein